MRRVNDFSFFIFVDFYEVNLFQDETSIYDLSDDNFALSPDYDLLYTELTGAVVLYIEEYGV